MEGSYINNFLEGDCLEVMDKLIEDKVKVSGIITSPPYNTSRTSNYDKRYDVYRDAREDREYIDWTLSIFDRFDKLLEEDGVILYNISYSTDKPSLMWMLMGEIVSKSNFNIVDFISWKKSTAVPNNVSPNRLTRIVEPIFVISRKGEESSFNSNKKVKSVRDNGQKMYYNQTNFIEAKNNDGANDYNKATYSSELVYKLIEMYIKENSIILDPFMGSGTTAIGCLRANRLGKNLKYIGIELSNNQVKYSEDRVRKFKKEKSGLWGSI